MRVQFPLDLKNKDSAPLSLFVFLQEQWELMLCGRKTRIRETEIDFIIQRDGQLIPIEVKSADNTRAKSLKIYMETYKPTYAIKLSSKNFCFDNNKKSFLFMLRSASNISISFLYKISQT